MIFRPPAKQLLVPPHVAAELREETLRYAQGLAELFDFDDPICRKWNPELARIAPGLRLGKAKPMAYKPGYPVQPGYYHFLRETPGAPPSCDTITGPDGESYAEPDSTILEKIRSNDLLDPRVVIEMEAARERQRADEEYEKRQRREERQTEIYDRYVAGNRTFVSMSDATPWTQSATAKRGATKK